MKHSKSNNSEKKAAFRRTKTWKEWRQQIADGQNGKDAITGKRLSKMFHCHHLDMSAENYDKLIEENFICLNKQMHDTVHILFRYYAKDPSILEKLEKILDRMNELNI